MRSTTTTTTGQSLKIEYPNRVAFMYSPQLVRVSGEGTGSATLTVNLTHLESRRVYSETRAFYGGAVEFDISRAMQLLAPDVDELFRRLDYSLGQSLAESFALALTYTSGNATKRILSIDDIKAMYGALDQGETYGEDLQRRLWFDLPQTFNLWDADGDVYFSFTEVDVYPDLGEGGLDCYECGLVDALYANGEDHIINRIKQGQPVQVGMTFRTAIADGSEKAQGHRKLTLKPEFGTAADGTYLRWLNRRGEVSYWLFTNSQVRVTSAANDGFERHYNGDPSIPVSNSYVNRHKADFREAREMVIGAVGLSLAEYEDLCSLATSPLVERFTKNAWDSPDNTKWTWQRVNVTAGTYSRNIRRQTPSLQDLEFMIELPERNTIKL